APVHRRATGRGRAQRGGHQAGPLSRGPRRRGRRRGDRELRRGRVVRPSTPWRDTAWNLAGFILPLPVAVAAVPILMEGLGEARFGLLTLTWAVMAYFTLFDVGLGRATTQGIVRARAAGDTASMLDLCWSSTWAHLGLGLCGGVVLLLVGAPIRGLLGLPPGLAREFDIAIVWLALSVPCIVLATGARGVLEGL